MKIEDTVEKVLKPCPFCGWPQPKRIETALALIAKTLREALDHGK